MAKNKPGKLTAKDRVFTAAKFIYEDTGITPTVAKVVDHAGMSKRDVLKPLNEWKKEFGASQEVVKLSPKAMKSLQDIYTFIEVLLKSELTAMYYDFDAARAAASEMYEKRLELEIADAFDRAERLESEILHHKNVIREQESEIEKLKKELKSTQDLNLTHGELQKFIEILKQQQLQYAIHADSISQEINATD